jgi:hypothetical protein
VAQILTQKQADEARRRLLRPDAFVRRRSSLCYLCGSSLPPLGIPNRSKLVQVEHVIPDSIRGPAPAQNRDRWSITAEVHTRCDAIHKSRLDEHYRAIEAVSTGSPAELSKQQAAIVAKHVGPLHVIPDGRVVGTLSGVSWMYDAVWAWVRGCHSLLHGNFLPPCMARQIVSPFEMIGDDGCIPFSHQLAEQASQRSMAAGMCELARQHDCLNRIVCWGGKVEYLSAWCEVKPKAKGTAGWPACLWLLSTPMLGVFSETLRGKRLPWAGMYLMPCVPANAVPIPREVLRNAAGYRNQVARAVHALLPGLYSSSGQ